MSAIIEDLSRQALDCKYAPSYDGEKKRAQNLFESLSKKIRAKFFYPENDLYSHLIIADFGSFECRAHVRFDLKIFVVSYYDKNGAARYFSDETPEKREAVKSLIDSLKSGGLVEIDFGDAQKSLGPGPIEAGLNGDSLFCFYFEDV